MSDSVWTRKIVSVPTAEKIADVFLCDISANIGDLVIPSTTIEGAVEVLTSNVFSGLCFGVIVSKPTTTTAEVLVSGRLSGLSGLPIGKPLFVGTTGILTATKPLTGHLQVLGLSITQATAFLMPSLTKVIQA
jgi:hypothetical protein